MSREVKRTTHYRDVVIPQLKRGVMRLRNRRDETGKLLYKCHLRDLCYLDADEKRYAALSLLTPAEPGKETT